MSWRFETYRLAGHRSVAGWLRTGTLTVVKALDAAQRSKNVSGGIAEIGVHHGRFFIGLSLLQRSNESSVAIDLFDEQEHNIDKSGRGDLERFRANVRRWCPNGRVVVRQGDSTKLTSADVCGSAESSIRFFSVDGGHTDATVFSDMNLAERALSSGGIVIADDIFNEWWPEVAAGTLRYLEQGGKLQPFAVGFNKVFFAFPEEIHYYREFLADYLDNRYPLTTKTAHLGGSEVLVVGRFSPRPRRLIGRSKFLKKTYHRFSKA